MDNNSQFNPIVVVKGIDKKPAFFKRIQAPFSKLSLPSNMNKKFAGAMVALLLVFGVGLGVFLAQRQTQLRPRASANGVDIKIDPAAFNATVNQEFNVDVVLDAKQASASAAQVKVTFDSQKMQLVSTTLGSFMPVVLQQPTPTTGAVAFVVGTSTPHGGSGSVATLRFKPLVDLTTTTIAIDPANTIVTVVNFNDNQTGDLTPSTITVGADTVSPAAGFNPDSGDSLKNDLIAYWKMDEASGSSSLDSVGGHNAAWNTTQVVPGKIGKAQNVWASNSWLAVADTAAFSTDTMTVAGWVKPTRFGAGNFASIFNFRPATNNAGMTLEYAGYSGLGTGQLQCQVFITSPQNTQTSAGLVTAADQKITLNEWSHVACSYDGTTAKLYINGSLVTSSQVSGKMRRLDSGMNLWLGRNLISNQAIYGHLDEIGYWGRALTQTEISNLYNGGQGNTYTLGTSNTQPETSLKLSSRSPVTVGQEFAVPVQARSDIENSNLFVAKINFPKDLLEVVNIDNDLSFVTSWAEKFYDNQTGQISLVGGVTNPGFKSSNADAVMATIHFRAKGAGSALVDLTSESQIFSNANNQNIIQKTTDTTIQINGTRVSPSPSPSSVSCNTDNDCAQGQTCQWVPVCTGGEVNCASVVHICQAPASPSPSPSTPLPSPSVPNCSVLKGDGNADCVVNLTDLSIMLSSFSATNTVPAGKQLLDFNNDNRINTFDFSSMADKLFQLGIIKRRS